MRVCATHSDCLEEGGENRSLAKTDPRECRWGHVVQAAVRPIVVIIHPPAVRNISQLVLLVMLAGWMNRHQKDVIEYLKEENRILQEKLGTKRVLLNDNQRIRLARLGKRLGRKVQAITQSRSYLLLLSV
jgi:hypothetical protein